MADHALEAPAATRRGARSTWARLAWRQYRLERRMFWRNVSAAFFNFMLPLLFLALFGAVFAGKQKSLDVVVPGIAAMSVMSTTFTALCMNITYLRETGILKRVHGTPTPASAYLAGLAGHAITNTAMQVSIVVVAGRLFFGVGWPKDPASLVAFVALGAACFAVLGVALSHAIPNFDSAPAYTNAVFLPTVIISGVFYDADNAPAVLRDIAEVLPLKHLIDGLSGAMVKGEGIGSHLVAVIVLLLWGGAGAVLAIRGFSWDRRRS
jgi:ABC-2 type transport system permease protein